MAHTKQTVKSNVLATLEPVDYATASLNTLRTVMFECAQEELRRTGQAYLKVEYAPSCRSKDHEETLKSKIE